MESLATSSPTINGTGNNSSSNNNNGVAKKGQKSPAQLLAELNEHLSPTSGKRVDQVRAYFEQLVTAFPLSGRFWKLYVELEMKQRDYERVEHLFQRCLIRVLHIELWRCYLHYIRETKSGAATYREKMGQAYEFALDKVGIDFLSYPIWNEYVQFLKGVDAPGSFAENQKITAVRRVYQRGIVNPMLNIEQFWKDYLAYEHSINSAIAEKMNADRSRDYMTARRVAKEYEAHTKGLNRNALAMPPTGRPEERRQTDLWQRYIHWEISNPLRLEEPMQIIRRVVFAYEQCLLCMAQHLDMWLDYAAFLDARSRTLHERGDLALAKQLQDDSAAVFERAIQGPMTGPPKSATTTSSPSKPAAQGPMAGSTLLHFAWADFEEARNRKEKAGEVYQKLLASPLLTDATLAYIQYIRFARRSEGIKAARLVFKKAREDVRTSHKIYTFAALMEFYCSKDHNVACKIFELGLKKYSNQPDYVLAYIDFFSQLNQENNTRVLFERVLSSGHLSDQDALLVWDRFLQFEADVGDLQSIQKVEKRRAQVLDKLPAQRKPRLALQWTQRYRFGDLLPLSVTEVRAFRHFPGAARYLPASAFDLNHDGSSASSSSSNDPFQRNKKDSFKDYGNGTPGASSQSTSLNAMCRPDLSQMLPFKPIRSAMAAGQHPIPGGVFPPPPAVAHFLSLLPHPLYFTGPFVQVDELINIFRQLPDQIRPSTPNNNNGMTSHNVRQFDVALKSMTAACLGANDSDGLRNDSPLSSSAIFGDAEFSRKRRPPPQLNDDADDDDADDDNSNSNPTHFDIYRRRQLLKRVK